MLLRNFDNAGNRTWDICDGIQEPVDHRSGRKLYIRNINICLNYDSNMNVEFKFNSRDVNADTDWTQFLVLSQFNCAMILITFHILQTRKNLD
jgi:hypothetical protein